ncbi:MAG: TonB-dependent receptor plug domain-containing protein [Hyphomicrobiaceae bacterium]
MNLKSRTQTRGPIARFDWVRGAAHSTAAALAATCVTAGPALAQQAPGTVALPPVVIEGAALAKPVVKAKPVAKPQSAVADDATPASGTKKKTKVKSAASAPAAPGALPQEAGSIELEGEIQPSSSATRGVPRDEVGTATSVVTRQMLEAAQIRTAADALRALPGVSVSQQGGAGNISVVRIRGAESNHTLVIIDGVEVNPSTDGFYDFANLSADDIERIEVLRGPQSGLYGSGALGGVVNIVTRSGRGPLTLRAEGEAGSFDTKGGRVAVSGGTDTAWGSLTLSRRETGGFNIAPVGRERDGSTLSTLSAKAGFKPFEALTVSGSFRTSRLDGDRDDFNGIVGGYFVANDNLSTFDTRQWSGRLDAELSLFDGAWTQKIFATRAHRDAHDIDRGLFPSNTLLIDDRLTYGYTTTVRLDSPGSAARHYVTGLIEKQDERFEQPDAGNFSAERGRLSFAGEVRGEYWNLVHLGATVRHDDNEVFDDATSWRLQGSARLPSSPFRLHASYGTGIKYPSFAELYGTFFRYTPNPNLRPETSRGWDVGVETTLWSGRAVIDVTWFKSNLRNEIVDDFSAFPLITSDNLAGTSRRQGLEVAGRVALLPGVTLGAAYTYLDAVDDQGLTEVRRPRHQGRFDIDWRSADRRAALNFSAVYNGKTIDNAFLIVPPFAERYVLDDYWLLRIAGSYELVPGVEMFGRVENLLDQDYQEVFGYETAGLAAYAGLRIRLETPLDVARPLK